MEKIWDMSSLIFLSIAVSCFAFIIISKMKSVNTAVVFIATQYFIAFILVISQIVYINNYLGISYYQDIIRSSLSGMHSIYLALFALLSIREISKKKLQTLWRIPLIGILAGMLATQYLLGIHLFISILILFIFYKNRKQLHTKLPFVVMISLWSILIAFIDINSIWNLNLYTITLLSFGHTLNDEVIIKMMNRKINV